MNRRSLPGLFGLGLLSIAIIGAARSRADDVSPATENPTGAANELPMVHETDTEFQNLRQQVRTLTDRVQQLEQQVVVLRRNGNFHLGRSNTLITPPVPSYSKAGTRPTLPSGAREGGIINGVPFYLIPLSHHQTTRPQRTTRRSFNDGVPGL